MDQVLIVYNCSKIDCLGLDCTVVSVFDKFDINIVRCLFLILCKGGLRYWCWRASIKGTTPFRQESCGG